MFITAVALMVCVFAIFGPAGATTELSAASENTVALSGATTMRPDLTAINISPFITVSQCAPCHGSNFDNFKNPGLIFKHDPHLARGVRCAACHDEFPHTPMQVKKPPMDVCYNCHGLKHSSQGLIATGACNLCHPAGFTRLPADHTPAFRAKDHKAPASINYFSCVACHGEQFCVTCHNQKNVVPGNHTGGIRVSSGSAATPTQIAALVKAQTNWKAKHGHELDKGGCKVCHDNAFCTKCHKTPMPHPAQWLGDHKGISKTIPARVDCKVCHQGKTECSSCHHRFEETTLLTQPACTSCHPEYTKPLSELTWGIPIGLRSKGIVIHKAHFEMTRTDPFECNECHGRDYVTAKDCFSFELCYECHGRVRGGSLIAKWGGQELCYRCHKMK